MQGENAPFYFPYFQRRATLCSSAIMEKPQPLQPVQHGGYSRHSLIMGNLRDSLLSQLAALNPSVSINSDHGSLIERRLGQLFKSFHTPTHPPYALMIQRAVMELNEETGSTESAISEFIQKEYTDLPWAHVRFLGLHLRRLCQERELVCTKSGRYMLWGGDGNCGAGKDTEWRGSKKRKQGKKSRNQSSGERNNTVERSSGNERYNGLPEPENKQIQVSRLQVIGTNKPSRILKRQDERMEQQSEAHQLSIEKIEEHGKPVQQSQSQWQGTGVTEGIIVAEGCQEQVAYAQNEVRKPQIESIEQIQQTRMDLNDQNRSGEVVSKELDKKCVQGGEEYYHGKEQEVGVNDELNETTNQQTKVILEWNNEVLTENPPHMQQTKMQETMMDSNDQNRSGEVSKELEKKCVQGGEEYFYRKEQEVGVNDELNETTYQQTKVILDWNNEVLTENPPHMQQTEMQETMMDLNDQNRSGEVLIKELDKKCVQGGKKYYHGEERQVGVNDELNETTYKRTEFIFEWNNEVLTENPPLLQQTEMQETMMDLNDQNSSGEVVCKELDKKCVQGGEEYYHGKEQVGVNDELNETTYQQIKVILERDTEVLTENPPHTQQTEVIHMTSGFGSDEKSTAEHLASSHVDPATSVHEHNQLQTCGRGRPLKPKPVADYPGELLNNSIFDFQKPNVMKNKKQQQSQPRGRGRGWGRVSKPQRDVEKCGELLHPQDQAQGLVASPDSEPKETVYSSQPMAQNFPADPTSNSQKQSVVSASRSSKQPRGRGTHHGKVSKLRRDVGQCREQLLPQDQAQGLVSSTDLGPNESAYSSQPMALNIPANLTSNSQTQSVLPSIDGPLKQPRGRGRGQGRVSILHSYLNQWGELLWPQDQAQDLVRPPDSEPKETVYSSRQVVLSLPANLTSNSRKPSMVPNIDGSPNCIASTGKEFSPTKLQPQKFWHGPSETDLGATSKMPASLSSVTVHENIQPKPSNEESSKGKIDNIATSEFPEQQPRKRPRGRPKRKPLLDHPGELSLPQKLWRGPLETDLGATSKMPASLFSVNVHESNQPKPSNQEGSKQKLDDIVTSEFPEQLPQKRPRGRPKTKPVLDHPGELSLPQKLWHGPSETDLGATSKMPALLSIVSVHENNQPKPSNEESSKGKLDGIATTVFPEQQPQKRPRGRPKTKPDLDHSGELSLSQKLWHGPSETDLGAASKMPASFSSVNVHENNQPKSSNQESSKQKLDDIATFEFPEQQPQKRPRGRPKTKPVLDHPRELSLPLDDGLPDKQKPRKSTRLNQQQPQSQCQGRGRGRPKLNQNVRQSEEQLQSQGQAQHPNSEPDENQSKEQLQSQDQAQHPDSGPDENQNRNQNQLQRQSRAASLRNHPKLESSVDKSCQKELMLPQNRSQGRGRGRPPKPMLDVNQSKQQQQQKQSQKCQVQVRRRGRPHGQMLKMNHCLQ